MNRTGRCRETERVLTSIRHEHDGGMEMTLSGNRTDPVEEAGLTTSRNRLDRVGGLTGPVRLPRTGHDGASEMYRKV